MDSVNKTLYIPLSGKSYVSKRGIILHDPKAEEIWTAEGFPLKGKAASKWLSFYMGMRAAVFDSWVKNAQSAMPDAAVLHLGCGMDSRVLRVGIQNGIWYDVDFPDVIAERKKYYEESEHYKMLDADVRDAAFLSQIGGKRAIVVMEGISMYLKPEELLLLLGQLCGRFDELCLLVDCYTEFAAKASKVRNPINEVGVTEVYGLDDPALLEGNGLSFVRRWEMTPIALINELKNLERAFFLRFYAGSIGKKMYRLYEYRK